MARVRMFANLREIAGTGRAVFPGNTVAGVVDAASEAYGPDFARGLQTSRVWVNGREARLDDPVDDEDEVVLLPPVSGGSQPAAVSTLDLAAFLPLAVALVAVVANLQAQEIWAASLVAISAVWALDLGSALSARGHLFASLAVVTSAACGALSAHILGGAGYGLALAIAVAVCLGWAVAFKRYRRVDAFAPTLLAGLLVGLGVASLVLVRGAAAPDGLVVDIFLVSVIAGVLAGAIVARMPAMPFLDSYTTTAIVAVVGAVAAAALWDGDVVGYLLVGLGVAVALVAGTGLASMMRTGRVRLSERPPGLLSSLDGVVLAAALFYPLVRVIL
ncbi:MAG: MoaD/ThiS family protein [Actinobacteria bacterium]|nr:MoaD/ThiS family protein [Actinomycetota bacterium]